MASGNEREIVVDWLNSAYNMERQLIPVMDHHAKDAEHSPELRARIEQHAEETRRHADLIKGCLEQMGEEPSEIRGKIAGLAGRMQSVATGAFKDEDVKNVLSDFATEQFEIAAYQALSEAARAIGEEGIAETCEEIMREEKDMADFLQQQISGTVREALGRRE